MEPIMCLSVTALAAFVQILDPEIVETKDNRVIIHTESGPVEWVYFKSHNVFALDGKISYCIKGEPT